MVLRFGAMLVIAFALVACAAAPAATPIADLVTPEPSQAAPQTRATASATQQLPAEIPDDISTPAPAAQIGSVDPLTAQLLRRYGLVPSGPTTIRTIHIEEMDGPQWSIPLEDSRKIGLDFALVQGIPVQERTVQMRTTPVVGNLGPQYECAGCSKGGRVHVLVAEGRMVGAYLSDEVSVPGIYALSEVDMWCGDDDCEPGSVPVPEPPQPRPIGAGFMFTPVPSVPPEAIPPGPAIEDYRATTGGALVTRPPDVVEYGIAQCPGRDPECFGTRNEAMVWLAQWSSPEQGQWLIAVVDASTGKLLTARSGSE